MERDLSEKREYAEISLRRKSERKREREREGEETDINN